MVRTLGQVERTPGAMALPVKVTAPPVSAEMLAGTAGRARTALSGPVVLRSAQRSFRLPRWRVAELLTLPSGGATKLVIGGAAADAYFRNLSENIGRPARNAEFAVYGESVQVVPARDGLELNVPKAARAIMRAATRPTNRVAQLTVARALPDRTTAEALAMGIDTRMASYKTYYSGTSDRITNLQLGVGALDGTLVAPGGTFSLNEAIGERTIERGFRPAPVIIGNEYAEEVGGGTSQVATTAFNAAWEAGLRITERNPHSLYISRYQLGRDATVYWPSLDLKFVNDTDTWVLVRDSRRATESASRSTGASLAAWRARPRRSSSPAPFRSSASMIRRSPRARPSSKRRGRHRRGPRRRATSTRPRASCSTRRRGRRPTRARSASFTSGRRWRRRQSPSCRQSGPARRLRTSPALRRSLGRSDRLGEPLRDTDGPIRLAIHGRVSGSGVGDELAVTLDPVLVAKRAPRTSAQRVQTVSVSSKYAARW